MIVLIPLIITFALQLKLPKAKIKYTQKHFLNYLKNECGTQYFSNLLIKQKTDIASYFNSNKPSGPCRRLIFLLKHEIPKNLVYWFKLSFMTGVFPLSFKTADFVPTFKKASKLDHSNFCSISLLSNIEKILEKVM